MKNCDWIDTMQLDATIKIEFLLERASEKDNGERFEQEIVRNKQIQQKSVEFSTNVTKFVLNRNGNANG